MAGEQPRPFEASVASAAQVAHITLADERKIAVLEIKVTGHVDLQRNRVGLRNLVTRFIDQQSAHGVLAFLSANRATIASLVAQTSSFHQTASSSSTKRLHAATPIYSGQGRLAGLPLSG